MGTGLRRRSADRPNDAPGPFTTRRVQVAALAGVVVLLAVAAVTLALVRDTGPATAAPTHSAAATAPAAAAAAQGESASHATHAGPAMSAAAPAPSAGHAGMEAHSAAAAPAKAAESHASSQHQTHTSAAPATAHAEMHTQMAASATSGAAASGGAGEEHAAMGASVGTAAMPEPNVTTVRYGPIPALPSLLGSPMSTTAGVPLLANLPLLPAPCTNCYATGTTIDMVYENGQPANLDTGVMLHHLVLFQPQVDDVTCARTTPVGLLGQRFFASGNERTAGNLPEGYGIHLGGGPLAAYFEIMNHSSELKLVYITATVRWLPDTTPGIKAVEPVWFDENNCSTSTYGIPAGPSSRTWKWTSTLTGRFVTAAGHVHDGGVRTMLMNESTGEHVCSSVAGYGTKPAYMGSIESMSLCSWDRLGTVRKGEVLSLTTDYVSSQPQSDVMGIMLAYLYPTDDLTGGTPAPGSVNDPSPMTPPPVMHEHGG